MAVMAGVRGTVHRLDAFDRSEDIKIESAMREKAAQRSGVRHSVFEPAGFSLKESYTALTLISEGRDVMLQ